ncbi:hypothetical protein PSACC_02459 [Paramicrosporidium saccamoebae]|uniref:Uncharacterized protein n=1 Tax=Paramicrosporidium saccamoebae TaxID=1246581 RepID=A0A2H9TJ21_9FUNG|nr:hypothetical protein PSACC_02459 [Paramicrosporidium saccamoebae]
MMVTPLVLFLTLSLEYASCSTLVGQPTSVHGGPSLETPGPHTKIKLELNCLDLFRYPLEEISGVMRMAIMSDPKNYRDIAQCPECSAAASSKCDFINEDHVRQLMEEEWTWPEDGSPPPKVADRYIELNKSGCLPKVSGLSALTMKDDLTMFKGLNVASWKYWSAVDPEVLSFLLEQDNIRGGMARLSPATAGSLHKIIAHDFFRDGRKLNWLILDSNVISFVVEKMPELAESLATAFAEVARSLEPPALQAVMAIRMEMLVNLLLQENPGNAFAIVKLLSESRNKMAANTADETVINILKHVAPETASLFDSFERYHEDKEDIEDQSREIKEILGSFGTIYSAEEGISFGDYKTLLESFADATIPLGNLIDFIQLYSFINDRSIYESEPALVASMIDEAFGELNTFVQSNPDEVELYNPPSNVFRFCSAMIRYRMPAARECVAQINRVFKSDETGDRSGARTAIMAALGDFVELAPALYAMAETEKELLDLLLVSFPENNDILTVDYDTDSSTFNIEDFLSKIATEPNRFANYYMKIADNQGSVGTFNDVGGPRRALLTDTLKHIDSKLMCGISENDFITRCPELAISRGAGGTLGAILGKGAQQGLRSAFLIDPSLLVLLCDPTTEKISEYFSKTYKGKLKAFAGSFLGYDFMQDKSYRENGRQCPVHDGNSCDCTYSGPLLEDASALKLEVITFHSLTAKSNLVTGTKNLGEYAELDVALTLEEVESQYMEPLRSKLLQEFTAFIQEVYKGMSYTLKMDNLKYLSDYNLFEKTMNPADVTGAQIFEVTKFLNFQDADGKDIMVKSLIPGVEISLVDSFKSFVYATNGEQKRRLLDMWAGSSAKRLGDKIFEVVFSRPVQAEKHVRAFYSFEKASEKHTMTVEGDHGGNSVSESNQVVEEVEIRAAEAGGDGAVPVMEVEVKRVIDPEQLENIAEEESWSALPPGTIVKGVSHIDNPHPVLQPGLDYIVFMGKAAKIQSMMLGVPPAAQLAAETTSDGSFFPTRTTTCHFMISVPKADSSMAMLMSFVHWLNGEKLFSDIMITEQENSSQ